MMEKMNKFFLTTLLAGLVALCLNTTVAPNLIEAQSGPNSTIEEEDTGDRDIKLVVSSRTKQLDAPAVSMPAGDVQCEKDEVVTGGGFKLNDPTASTIIASNKMSNGWAVSFVNNGDRSTFATIFAQCAHIEISP
jgi:hypothetical protein